MKNLIKLMFSIFVSLFIIILSVKITLNFKFIYYSDIDRLNIGSHTILNKSEIKSTYDYLIYYINTKDTVEFKIPLLPSSEAGIVHFEEVKKIFIKLNYLLYLSIIITTLAIYYMYKYKDFSPLNWCSNLLLLGFLFLGIIFGINFDKSFTFFHKLFFNNGYWLFDPKTDPVINILPQEFFFHYAMLIVTLIIGSSITLKITYKKLQVKG